MYKYSPLKGNLEEYKKILTGKIQYDPPSGDLLRFKGTLKLKKDPISEELTIDNVALKGSILAFSDWVIGLVIYVGTDVKASYKRLPNYLFHQGNLYDKLLNGLNLMAFIMIIINCIICFIRILSNNDLFHQIFKDNVMEILFVNFTIMIPSNIAILIQCISLFHKYIIEKKYKGNLTLVDPNKFGYLNQITHLIIDKNCALESSRSSIYSIYLPEKKNFFLNSKIKQSNNMYSFPKMPLQEKPPLIKTIKCTKATSKIDLLKCDSIQSNLSEERNIYPFPKPLVYKFSAVIEELNSFNYNKESNLQLNKESGFKNYKNLKEGESPFFKDFNAYDNANLAKFGDLTDILEIGRKIPDNYEDVFKALLLCHEISTKEDVVEKNNCSYLNQFAMPDSETILDFTKQYHHKLLYQCSILNNSMKCYNTLINDQSAQYYILGIQNHNHNIGKYDKYYKFSILLKPAISLLNNKLSQGSFENSTLYFRTDDPSYIDLLDLEELEKDIIKQKMDILKARGLRFVIFSQKKNIEEDEINEYIHHIKKNVEFSSGSLKIENNNELIAILAIKDKPAPGLKSLINDFLTIENKVWLLSNDSEDIVISTAFLLGIIDKQHELLRLEIPLDSCNCNEGWIKIRSILNKLRKSLLGIDEININKNKTTSLRKSVREKSAGLKIFLTGKPIYCLIINGKTFELLCKDQNFLNHFVFIAYFCHSLIGYGMKPKDKEFLLTLIKTKFPNNPITMVIGDGYDDLSMMKQADLSIEIKNKNSKENTGKLKEKDTIPIKVGIVGGDIYTNSFIILRDLIRVQSFSFNHKMINIIFYCYSASFIYILPSTFYTLFFGNLVCPIINPNLFFTKDILILNAISFIYFFWGRKKSENILKIFQWTYKDGKNEMKNFYKFAFWKIFGISIFESIIIIIFIIYGQNFVKLGNVLLWEEFSTFLFSTIFFIICSKMINYFKYKVAISILITILSLIIYFISGLIPFSSNSFQSNSLNNIYDISRNLDLLLLILFLIICNLIHSYFNAKFFSNKFFLDIYGKIKKYLKDGMNVSSLKMRSFSNENEGKFVLKNIGDVISHIFKDTNMDSILQDSK